MSMWEIEALGEEAIKLVDTAKISVAEKRNFIIWIYDMIGGWDTSFIHFRTTDILIRNACFFAMSPTAHPEYASRKTEIDAFIEEGESWLKTPDTQETEAIHSRANKDEPKQFWYDPRMALWKKSVAAGLLEGLAAEPVPKRHVMEVLPDLMELAHNVEDDVRAACMTKMFHGFGAYDIGSLDRGSEPLKRALALPRLHHLLNLKLPEDSNWINERFDARLGLEYAKGENLENLKWWCSVYAD